MFFLFGWFWVWGVFYIKTKRQGLTGALGGSTERALEMELSVCIHFLWFSQRITVCCSMSPDNKEGN